MPLRPTPPTASIAEPGHGAQLYAPSAARNIGPLCDLLGDIAPAQGRALELASGTGQHIVAFARALPGLQWQPSDIAADRRASIDAHVTAAALDNVAAPLALDVALAGWGARHTGQALIVVVNLLHLISTPEAATLAQEAATALTPGGRLVVYGPFMRKGELTSPGDRAFHAALVAQDPETGYKDDQHVIAMMQASGLKNISRVEMPANNLALIFEKPAI